MALEVNTSSAYQGLHNPITKPEQKSQENITQESGAMKISVTETPTVVKSSGSSQNSSDSENGQKDNAATEKQIKNAISRVNNKMKNHRTRCEFSYHELTKRVSIKILDKETNEVIREIPPEETLEMIERMWELAGLLIDERR